MNKQNQIIFLWLLQEEIRDRFYKLKLMIIFIVLKAKELMGNKYNSYNSVMRVKKALEKVKDRMETSEYEYLLGLIIA